MTDPSPPSSRFNAARLATPAIAERIRAAVRGRVPESDVPDVIQGTYLRALIAPELPDDLDGLLRLVSTIARGLTIDFQRANGRPARRVAEGAEPDELAPDDGAPNADEPAAVREMLEWVELEVARGDIAPAVLRWAHDLAAGATYEEIAAPEGKSASAVKVAVHRARKALHHRWEAYVAAGAFGAVLAFWFYIARRPDLETRPPPQRRSVATASSLRPAPPLQDDADAPDAARTK